MPRAIAIDLDGTLLNSQTQLSERNQRALERCIARGIPVIIATSRPIRIFNRIFPQGLRQKCSYIVMNGAIAKGNPPLSGYFKESLPEEMVCRIIETGRHFDQAVRVTLELDGYEFGVNWEIDYSTLWQRNSATPNMVLSVEEALKRQPRKVAMGRVRVTADLAALTTRLQEQFGDQLSVVPALIGTPLLNITSKNATKPEALRKLLGPYGISLNEVLALGDDFPDVDMLKECGISVAMANALPEVKAVCKYQTASNDEEGVALVLEKMLSAIA
ncbi:MAG TPA: HAD family hydrolase [Dehalococcoidales bacterium]